MARKKTVCFPSWRKQATEYSGIFHIEIIKPKFPAGHVTQSSYPIVSC